MDNHGVEAGPDVDLLLALDSASVREVVRALNEQQKEKLLESAGLFVTTRKVGKVVRAQMQESEALPSEEMSEMEKNRQVIDRIERMENDPTTDWVTLVGGQTALEALKVIVELCKPEK